jgi:phytoene dehydrogenase-like protein
VLLTAYPETRRTLDYDALQLRPFFPGAVILRGGRRLELADPWRRPLAGIASVASGAVGLTDGLRMARFRARVRRASERERQAIERTSLQRLRREGFSERLIATFFRPFFGGVFLDGELQTSERQLEFVFRMFSAGDIAVPARGMGQISHQLAERLPDEALRISVRAARVERSEVVLEGGERLQADAVVVATDSDAARELGADVDAVDWCSTTCLYFAADHTPLTGPKLVLNGGDDGPINNLCVMSEVAPELAPPGQALVSVTVVGGTTDDSLEASVRRQLAGWFGDVVNGWRLLHAYRIERALPAQSPPRPPRRPPRLSSGLYVCGDHWRDGSINGAMASGRAAAQAVLHDVVETHQ